jgi:hypothetical protein
MKKATNKALHRTPHAVVLFAKNAKSHANMLRSVNAALKLFKPILIGQVFVSGFSN